MVKQVINVKGMSCNHCKIAVESELKAIDGVSSAVVDLQANNVTVEFDEAKADLEKIKEGIEEAGFEAV